MSESTKIEYVFNAIDIIFNYRFFFSFSFNKTDKIDKTNDLCSTVFILFSFENDI